jgi:TolB-like protein/Tfp pilus assembly protein PilF
MSFFNELKRRNVFRVGIAYAVASWVLLQIVDLVLENITAPDWVMQVFMLALAIGFPITVIMAWAFEMTPEGIKRETEVDRSQSITPKTGRKLDRIIIAFLALAVVFLIIDPFEEGTEPATGEAAPEMIAEQPATQQPEQLEKSVAVLPFAFRSNNPDDEFFAEGMHDDLLTQLAKIGSLKVISRTSVMEYKDTTKKIPQIATELGVATIVEGGVQRSGSRIRFNAQLIDANTDEHLWAETYNRELTAENLFDIQAEIARAIAQALQATLSPEEEASFDQAMTSDLKAWESYQRAIRMRQQVTIQAIRAGIIEINRALELDPEFAAAWSLKAILLLQQFWFYDTDPATRDAAWNALQRGRALNSNLPELDLAEGFYYYWGFRDYEKALPFMQKASAAIPNDSRVHLARAYVLRRMGDWENTLAALQRANELDPRESSTLADMAGTLTILHRFDEARSLFERAQELSPDDPYDHWEKSTLQLMESGDVSNYAHQSHIHSPPHPEAQLDTWRSSLYADDFEAALRDVDEWQDRFLDSKDSRVTRPMLKGLTHRYSGDTEKAQPYLLEAKTEFESLLIEKPGDFPIIRSLCFITGALGELTEAEQYCQDSLVAAPKDAYAAWNFKFDAAAGLALAGDVQGAVKLLKAMLEGEAGPTMYPVIYHPAFDGIREDAAYLKLLEQYGP